MNIKVYTTPEISNKIWEEIIFGFQEAFEKSDISIEALRTAALNTFCGYSYHAIATDENGELAGYNIFIPFLYNKGFKVIVSGSTFVRKKFRKDIFLLADMIEALRVQAKKDGFIVELGVPNINAINYAIKVNGLKVIADLNYYVLPIRISKFIKRTNIKVLDNITYIFSFIILGFAKLFAVFSNTKEKKVKYEINSDEDFWKTRFNQEQYKKNFNNGEIKFCYRIVNEKGINTAYLMDFREQDERSFKALINFVEYILLNESTIDAILFVGFLRLRQFLLIKTPKKYVPKQLPLTYFLYDNSYEDMGIADNWNFSLMNFDVR